MKASHSKTIDTNLKLKELLGSYLYSKDDISLHIDKHIHILQKISKGLPAKHFVIDSGKPWFLFWLLNSAEIIDKRDQLGRKFLFNTVEYLKKLKCPKNGSYGGSFGYIGHTVTTYASICALVTIGTDEALESINRDALYKFFMSLKNPNGSFAVHDNGESDVRGTYTVIVVAYLLNILTPELTDGVSEWIKSCQSYEGGFGGEPGDEAHGGYSYCAIATLLLLNKVEIINIEKFIGWSCKRHQSFECGFNGRTNKLVDGCYSFWVGSLIPMLRVALLQNENLKRYHQTAENCNLFFDRKKMIDFILRCCQDPMGGLRDKPELSFDIYHTAMCLSGLAISQWGFDDEKIVLKNDHQNPILLNRMDCILNVSAQKVENAKKFFFGKDCDKRQL